MGKKSKREKRQKKLKKGAVDQTQKQASRLDMKKAPDETRGGLRPVRDELA